MKLRPDEITKVLREQIEEYQGHVDVEEVGTVLQVGDGIARVHGLQSCVALEMLDLPHGVTGLALNLEEDNVGVVLLGEDTLIKEGINLEFRAELFNAFNHAQFGPPDGNVNSATFGLITTANQPRIVQLSLKLLF